MAIAKERYINSLMCLKAVTPALVQFYIWHHVYCFYCLPNRLHCCCAVSRGGAERRASCEATVAGDETALSLHMSWLQSSSKAQGSLTEYSGLQSSYFVEPSLESNVA